MVTKIQKLVRSRLWRKRKLVLLLAKVRKLDEIRVFCAQSLRICMQHFKDELIVASLSRSFEASLKAFLFPSIGGQKNQTLHSQHQRRPQPTSNAPVFPMMPMVFLVVSGAKNPFKWKEMDEKALLQTKLDRSRVVALFKAVNKHFQDNHNTKNSSKSLSTSPKAKSKTGTNAAFFSMTDVDLALAKAGGASKRALTFEEFIKVLRLLGEMKLTRVSVWWSKFDGSDAQLFSLLWDFLLVLPEFQPLVHQLDDFVTQVLSKRCLRIQQLFQRGNNLKHGLLMRLQMRKQLEAQAKARACTKLQARARIFLAKKQLRLRVQQVYEKYIDPEWGLPYWTNPKSGYSTWEKPRVLRAEDVATEVVPYPPVSLMLKIQCEGEQDCAKCAEWFCYECEEFFCGVCLPTFHKDKKSESLRNLEVDTETTESTMSDDQSSPNKKSSHEMEKIALCGLCQFQAASRKCLSCLPKPGQALMKKSQLASPLVSEDEKSDLLGLKSDTTTSNPEREALFCDTCFAFTHRRGAFQVHKSIELLEMCQLCSTEDDEDNEELHKGDESLSHGINSKKKQKDPARAVQHECEHYEATNKTTKSMRVCGKCVVASHPIELCGDRVKKIPLQTLTMLERARRIAEELEARDRADVEKMKVRALQAKRERHATRIQKFWRAKVPILRAKHIFIKLKTEKQERWDRLREDAKLENQFVYLVRNFFGLAKPLQTDTAVKKRLHEMYALQRRQLTIRARMFGLLAHEYMRVGIPLPGVGRILNGSPEEIITSEDLRGWVKNRQTIRLKRIHVMDPGGSSDAKKEKALENLSSWFHLSKWDHSDAATAGNMEDESSFEEMLVDVDAKGKLTERTIPLAQPTCASDAGTIGTVTTGAEEQQDGGEAVEEEKVFVMYLVEYSMDPRRVVWINHSLAERFWAWKRQKNLDRKERQRHAREEKERKARADADAKDTSTPAAGSTVSSSKPESPPAEQAPAGDVGPAEQQGTQPPYADYYSYSPSFQSLAAGTGGAEAPEAAAYGYDYSSGYNNYEYGYGYNDYNYDYTTGGAATVAETATYPVVDAPLVDSSGYFYAPDGNASAWQGYDYGPSAYNVSDPYYYNSYNYANGVADYGAAAGENLTRSAISYNSQSQEAYYEDANGNYNLEGAAWGDSAGYYDQQQPIATGSYSADQSYGIASGYADGYIDHHSQLPYPESQMPTNGGGDPGYSHGYATELGGYGQSVVAVEANENAQAAWEEVFDPQTSQIYYVNRITQETAWELPSST